MSKHFIAGGGMHGCLYDNCQSFETKKEAIEYLADLYELGRVRKETLAQNNYLELTPTPVERKTDSWFPGADYCEITECECNDPEKHNDN